MDPLREALTISSICNKVFGNNVPQRGNCRYYPKRGYRMGDRESVKALQWLAYIGQTKDNLIHAENGREVCLPEVPTLRVDGLS
jgi:hypothetical protein